MVPGLLLAGAIAAAATWLAQFPAVKNNGLCALTLAIIIGLVIGNTVYPAIASQCGSGIAFTKARLLRTGIVLYGLRLTFQDIGQVGMAGVVIDALVLSSTFLLAQWIGQKLLGMDKRTTLLVGAGASICGAAAVLATEPVAKGRAEDVAVAVAAEAREPGAVADVVADHDAFEMARGNQRPDQPASGPDWRGDSRCALAFPPTCHS